MAVPRLFHSIAVELESFGLSAAQPAATSKTHRLDQGLRLHCFFAALSELLTSLSTCLKVVTVATCYPPVLRWRLSVQTAPFLRVVSPFLPHWTILGMYIILDNTHHMPIFVGVDRIFPQIITLGTIPRVGFI